MTPWSALNIRHGLAALAFIAAGAILAGLITLVMLSLVDDRRCQQMWPGSHFRWDSSWGKQCVVDRDPRVMGPLP